MRGGMQAACRGRMLLCAGVVPCCSDNLYREGPPTLAHAVVCCHQPVVRYDVAHTLAAAAATGPEVKWPGPPPAPPLRASSSKSSPPPIKPSPLAQKGPLKLPPTSPPPTPPINPRTPPASLKVVVADPTIYTIRAAGRACAADLATGIISCSDTTDVNGQDVAQQFQLWGSNAASPSQLLPGAVVMLKSVGTGGYCSFETVPLGQVLSCKSRQAWDAALLKYSGGGLFYGSQPLVLQAGVQQGLLTAGTSKAMPTPLTFASGGGHACVW